MQKLFAAEIAAIAAIGSLALAQPVSAQEAAETREMYHIFEIETDAPRNDLIKALRVGLKQNTTDTQVTTPLVRGEPPEVPGTFEVVNPLEDGRFGALGALLSQAQAAEVMQVKCEGAVWIGNGQRRLRGAQRLRVTMCLFPKKAEDTRFSYNLDLYIIDLHEKGGGLDKRIGRAIAGAFVGDPGDWTTKTIVDILRRARTDAGARISYLEGQPAFEGTPWESETRLLPNEEERSEAENSE